MSLLWILCHYYITFLCRFNARPKNCWICFGYASFVLLVVCLLSLWFSFCGRFFGAYWQFILLWKLSGKPSKLFHSKWETEFRYQGQLKHPTPRMTKQNDYVVFYPMCPGRPCIRRSLRLWKERGLCYSFILFKILCHFSMVTSQKHHYTNKPTSQYSFIIAYAVILTAREGMYVCVCMYAYVYMYLMYMEVSNTAENSAQCISRAL